jgi:type IV pilus assembly protein PilP
MKKQATILLKGVCIVLLIGVLGCGQEAPAQQQAQAVSTKIAIEQPNAQPSAAVLEAPAAPAVDPSIAGATAIAPEEQAHVAAPSDQADHPKPEAQVAGSAAAGTGDTGSPGDAMAAGEASDLIKASLQIASAYDPKDRFNPFEPLFKAQPDVQQVAVKGEKRQRREPQTPLERVALSQLKVTAIIRAPSGNRAMVVDATGKGYVVTKDTYIGLNSGRVIDIDSGRILIEEEIETIMGELKIELAELKLQKPAGEL